MAKDPTVTTLLTEENLEAGPLAPTASVKVACPRPLESQLEIRRPTKKPESEDYQDQEILNLIPQRNNNQFPNTTKFSQIISLLFYFLSYVLLLSQF